MIHQILKIFEALPPPPETKASSSRKEASEINKIPQICIKTVVFNAKNGIFLIKKKKSQKHEFKKKIHICFLDTVVFQTRPMSPPP